MKKDARKKFETEGLVQLAFAALMSARETLHGAVMHAGMQVLAALLEQERAALCGPRYGHASDREYYRYGYADSSLAVGGRKVKVKRPRTRNRHGHEVASPTWSELASTDPLSERAVEQVLLGVSTRNYRRSLEPLPNDLKSSSTSKSSVSRRFVEATAKQLQELLSLDLSPLAIATVIIDGIHVGEHVVLVALGIDESGTKHVLGLHEGATENSAACIALMESLVARGLSADRSRLFVIDGSKAMVKAVHSVFGQRALIQRCQVHKKRNVTDHLPDELARKHGPTITAAYRSGDAARAKRMLEGLARQLEKSHPSAAASLREGLDETLTVTKLGLTGWLARTLSTTNAIEFINGRIRKHQRNVARWNGGEMVLRWTAAALLETRKTFRKLRGHTEMQRLVAALRAHDAKLNSNVAAPSRAA